ncbi:MAG: TIGR01458 family HAD-type hydrolase [Verrucomicrobiales bacterium]|nr:TIGR01458 family HAD-type hydrolase [Verrucomicrobiales bacterium]
MKNSTKAIFFDLSGVLYEGSRVIPGAAETIEEARSRGLQIRFVTNTATKTREDILDKLGRLGITAEPNELFTAPAAAAEYLKAHQLRPYCLVHESIEYEFERFKSGIPNAVLLGDARMKLHYDSLNQAFQLCMEGAPLIAIGKNRYFKTEEKLQIDSGAFVKGLEWAAGIEAVIVGKPSAYFYESVVKSTGFDSSQCLMVGDDLEGDIEAAVDAGLQATMVSTGKFRSGDEARLPDSAVLVSSVAELFNE